MARHLPKFAAPDWKMEDTDVRPKRSPQKWWELKNVPPPMPHYEGFAYVDRVGPEMFVGRYDHGRCDTVPEDAAKHIPGAGRGATGSLQPEPPAEPLRLRNHAYIATITPRGAESICLYCGTILKGCPKADLRNIPWDEPYERPRRATKREMDAMKIDPVPEDCMLYLDMTDGVTWTGRMRVGECPEGGPHEAVLCWWRHGRDPMFSFCAFCGGRWHGPPPGYWDAMEPGNTVERALERHAEDVKRGLY